MNTLTRLRQRLKSQEPATVQGQWRTIKLCLDEDAAEYLNVGVLFQHGSCVEVRMLDGFDRLKCLYGERVNLGSFAHLMTDIEETIRKKRGVFSDDALADGIRLGPPLFAAGAGPEQVVAEFFDSVVTLGRPSGKMAANRFAYQSSQKTRETVLSKVRKALFLDAEKIIRTDPYRLPLRGTDRSISLDIPLLGQSAASTIVSAWYKDSMVIENNLLHAGTDLALLSSNDGNIQKMAVSVLMPGEGCGMTSKEYSKHQDVAGRQIERLQNLGIEIMQANTTDELADQTVAWWQDRISA